LESIQERQRDETSIKPVNMTAPQPQRKVEFSGIYSGNTQGRRF